MEDDCACEYDSTWDTESDGDEPAGESHSRRSCSDKNKSGWTLTWHHTSRNMRAAKDMQNYRRGYPNLTDDECAEDKMSNLQFYLNKFPSAPDDVYIESFLKEWKNDYKRLERVHSYIQWLFPLREPGVNYMASELTKKEIEAFKKSDDAKKRLVESYELMLGFYGIRLVNKETGEVKRAENWKERFGNLERNMHNNLRITRILKSLGELGFEHYQAPLVHFFLKETLVKKTLSSVKRSVLDYFLFAVLDKEKRQELVRFAYGHFEPKDKFVWCPRKIQKQFRKAEKRTDAVGNGDGNNDIHSRGKSKDVEVVAQQKDDASDKTPKAQKGADKTIKEKNKPSETSPERKTEAEPVRNGNAEAESTNEELGNGNESLEEEEDMDQSPSPDTNPNADGFTDSPQEPDGMQIETDGDIEAEKPPKKKREDDEEPPSNGDLPAGRGEEKVATGQTSPSAQTPSKTSKHSPSLFVGREEKIPRTDFNQASDQKEEETSQAGVCAANGSASSGAGEQTDDKSDTDMKSSPSDFHHNVGNS
ncbi:opioid growth factor receptor [Antennarius striatus]|uniref:opioid growth factor receptor n=1 Tax=Antennarius striatus TaxID=241820 RepID=UPI0035B2354F